MSKLSIKPLALVIASIAMISGCNVNTESTAASTTLATNYQSDWNNLQDGHFLGEAIWSNPAQDWRVQDGELQCHVSGAERNIYLLTQSIAEQDGEFEINVNLRALESFLNEPSQGYVGFRIGVKGQYGDYRDSAIHGRGMKVGITNEGRLFIGNTEGQSIQLGDQALQLKLQGQLANNKAELTFVVADNNGKELAKLVRQVDSEMVTGGTGLSCHAGDFKTREASFKKRKKMNRQGNIGFAFQDWKVGGSLVQQHPDRTFGPIAFSMYTLDRNTLKMTAQMLPVPEAAGDRVELQLKKPGQGQWQTVDTSDIVDDSRTAHFRLEDWQYTQDVPFRVAYDMTTRDGKTETFYYEGHISKEPGKNEQVKVASLSCHLDRGFPHQDMVSYIKTHDTDMVMFTGDQYYEANAGYYVQMDKTDGSNIDYLRKWYQFGWAFRDLYRNVPSVFLVDDHDVFHGNIWGDGGKAASGKRGADIQDSGGFKMHAKWVNAVQRSMTAHMPDPVDPKPVKQDISVYFTDINYGGVSFAVLEDRKWKTSPRQALPEAKIVNGFSRNLDWDARTMGDKPGLNLLGERQMDFLDSWSQDWSGDARMKAVVSQTLFSSVQTRPKSDIISFKDRGMGPIAPGDYPTEDITVQDFDTNGWPQTPRKNALKLMRQASAFHIAGDTHLGVTFQYGIDGWNNGAWAIGSPAVANTWPRRWFPIDYPLNYKQGQPRNLGEYYDGFGNEITVRAVANPTVVDVEPIKINERAPGYNILTFNTAEQELTVEAWPRWVDPTHAGAKQFDGWPMAIKQTDNGYSAANAILPKINGLSKDGAVIQVIEQASGEIEYTLRFAQKAVQPKVTKAGLYTVRLYDGDMKLLKTLTDQRAKLIN